MSFLGPFEALWPVVEPFFGPSVLHPKWPEPPPRPVWKPPVSAISTWEKANSVKPDRVTFTWMAD